MQRLDFAGADAVETINAWAAQATDGVVPRLLSALEPDDALVLANAVQFKGEWSQPFDPARTAPLPFHLASGEAVEVPTMQADDLPARYRDDQDFQAVRLPYGEGAFALTVVLPRAGSGTCRVTREAGGRPLLAGRRRLPAGRAARSPCRA